jgi:energy-coupling factor transporter ATP-binding protein EcfA2
MHIIRYQAHNIMRVSDIDLQMAGKHLFLIGGKNGQGKTSTLTALLMALCGKRQMDWPESPLSDGESEGWVKVELSGEESMHDTLGFTAELKFRRKRTGQVIDELRLLDSTGEEAPEPKETLKRLFKLKAFDPLEFDRMKPKDQRMLLAEMVGLDLDKFVRDRKKKYDERTVANRDVTQQEARIGQMPKFRGVPTKHVDTGELLERLEAYQQRESSRQEKLNSIEADTRANEKSLKAIEGHQEEILRLQKAIEKEKDGIIERKKLIEESHKWCANNLPTEDITALKEAIQNAGETNKQVDANLALKEETKRLDVLKATSEQLTEAMKQMDLDQAEALQNAQWPVPGLGIDEEGVTLNGRAFTLASKSERVMASTRIGMALNPTLRLLVCEDGSDLDNDTLSTLQTILEANDFQMLIEIVCRTAADESICAVVIEDGKVKRSES